MPTSHLILIIIAAVVILIGIFLIIKEGLSSKNIDFKNYRIFSNFKFSSALLILGSLALGYLNCYSFCHKVWLSLVLAPLMGFALLPVIYGLFLILKVILEWASKHGWMKFVNSISLIIIIVGSFFLCQTSVRFFSARFAEPTSKFWEDAYYSTSPRATKYHYSKDCKFLNSTRFEIEDTYIEDAEKWLDLEPCKNCLEYSKKFQNDDLIFLVTVPVAIFLIWSYFRILKISKNYKFQSPLIKRTV